jgi:hypothetical protein
LYETPQENDRHGPTSEKSWPSVLLYFITRVFDCVAEFLSGGAIFQLPRGIVGTIAQGVEGISYFVTRRPLIRGGHNAENNEA